jgi:hypothetical protein
VVGLRVLAWYDGTRGRYGLLMLANLLRLLVVFFQYCLVLSSVGLGPTKESRPLSRVKLSYMVGGLLLILVCAGVPDLWPFVLGALAVVLTVHLALLRRRRRDMLTPGWGPMILRAGISGALFVVVWYQAASTTNSALIGLGERIDRVGAERLRAWAKQQIDTTPVDQRWGLRWNEVPEDVFEMMGSIEGWPIMWVETTTNGERCVFLANGSGYGYGIRIYPDDEASESAGYGMRWRPGIYLTTVSK